MKRSLILLTLTCVLSSAVLAGDMPTGGIAPPPSGGTMEATTNTKLGEIPTSGAPDQISSAGLSAVLSVLSFLTR